MTAIDEKDLSQQALNDILNSLLTDITAQKDALDTLVTKLNADAWVIDTDYTSSGALTTTAS